MFKEEKKEVTAQDVAWSIGTNESIQWYRAKKVQGLKAKPIINLMVDKSVANCFLLDTLEGREPLDMNAVFCIGEAGDAWQQMPNKLLAKYDVVDIDKDGWMICKPKPNEEVQCMELTVELLVAIGHPTATFIQGIYGAKHGELVNLQSFVYGDVICRNPADLKDQWIVRRNLFKNTYQVLGKL